MRFLVDRCVGRRVVEWLRTQGHDVEDIRGPDPGDNALLVLAHTENRILISIDKDFGQLIFLQKTPHRGIIRLPDVRASERILLLKQVLELPQAVDLSHWVVTIRAGRIRFSRSS